MPAEEAGLNAGDLILSADGRKVNGFAFNLLSDHDGEVSALFDAKFNRDFTPMKLDRISKRAAFVVDRRHAANRNCD